MKTQIQIPTRGGLALRADSIYALYGLGDRIWPDMGTGLRVWIPAKDEDLEAARGATDLTETLRALDSLAPPDHVPARRAMYRVEVGWNHEADWWRGLREHWPNLLAAVAIGYLAGALIEAIARGRLP